LQITNEIKTTEIRKGINVVAIYGGALQIKQEKLREAHKLLWRRKNARHDQQRIGKYLSN
jgi:hypothetical protein